MKLSISITFVILALGAIFGWQGHARLTETRETHRHVVTEAGNLGITIDRSGPGKLATVRSKHPREDRDEIARQVAIDFIAIAKESDALQKEGKGDDPEMQKKALALIDRLMALDSTQLKIVIAALRDDKSLGDEMRQGVVAFSIMMLSNTNPKAALALFTESSDLLVDGMMGKQVVSTSLASWAKDDPLGALEWMRKNGKIYPDLVTDESKEAVLAGAASSNPKLACKLITELGFEDPASAMGSIITVCKTPDERTAALAAARDFLKNVEGEETRIQLRSGFFGDLADEIAGEGFDKAMPWLSKAELGPAELGEFVARLSYQSTQRDTGKWIDWMARSYPPEQLPSGTGRMMEDWTRKDFKAAGTWLATAAEGPVKNTAIRSYAETVAEYEPQTAAQWALTLPAGKDRDATLESIHKKWPENDAQGKAAFAEEHGIQK